MSLLRYMGRLRWWLRIESRLDVPQVKLAARKGHRLGRSRLSAALFNFQNKTELRHRHLPIAEYEKPTPALPAQCRAQQANYTRLARLAPGVANAKAALHAPALHWPRQTE